MSVANSEVAPRGAKLLALFFDGTWNDTGDNTNVWRLKTLCADTDAGGREQLTYYDRGVNGLWGGSFGKGLIDNVLQSYEWLVEHYNNGDDIFIFGFSRGAYTARSLAGFVAKQGLLRRGSPLGVGQIYERYKRPNIGTIYQLQDQINRAEPASVTLEDRWTLKYSQQVVIKMVGVWDTVGALGVPAFHIPGVSSSTLGFLHTGLRQSIQNAYHAVAIDEHRGKFAPTLWTKLSTTVSNPRPIQEVEQRWFVGAHANVGGGYRSDPLSQPSLRWMMSKAKSLGLCFMEDSVVDSMDNAKIADSYGDFLHGIYRRFKAPYYRIINTAPMPTGKPNETELPINETIDVSVFNRWREDASYRPPNLLSWVSERNANINLLTTSVLASDPNTNVAD